MRSWRGWTRRSTGSGQVRRGWRLRARLGCPAGGVAGGCRGGSDGGGCRRRVPCERETSRVSGLGISSLSRSSGSLDRRASGNSVWRSPSCYWTLTSEHPSALERYAAVEPLLQPAPSTKPCWPRSTVGGSSIQLRQVPCGSAFPPGNEQISVLLHAGRHRGLWQVLRPLAGQAEG